MKFHHMCLIVRDIDESLKLYRDILEFSPFVDTVIPDDKYFDQKTLNDIFKVRGAKSRMVLAASAGGSLLEFQQPLVPAIQQTPDKYLRYGYTGFSELALQITDIDEWFDKIRAAGFETQTEYVWDAGGIVRSFIFYDADGHMVQMCENLVPDVVDSASD